MRFGLEDGSEHALEEVGQSFAHAADQQLLQRKSGTMLLPWRYTSSITTVHESTKRSELLRLWRLVCRVTFALTRKSPYWQTDGV